MAGNSVTLSSLWISFYFILNLFVTLTSKHVQSHMQSAWLLAASHAVFTFIVTSLLSWCGVYTSDSSGFGRGEGIGIGREKQDDKDDNHPDPPESRRKLYAHLLNNLHILGPFSLLYTINIVVSNWTLGLVSLTMHQTIRAIVPALTVILSITALGRCWREYSSGVYGAITLTICGVILAVNAAPVTSNNTSSGTNACGFAWTVFGATLAVAKTIASNHLQQPSRRNSWGLGLSSSVLVRYCSLCSMIITIVMGSWTGETRALVSTKGSILSGNRNQPRELWLWFWLLNALATSFLNIASFEANKRCGPLSMGVASNLKQVVILLFDLSPATMQPQSDGSGGGAGPGGGVILGSLMTMVGGICYAFAKAEMDRRRTRRQHLTENGG
ncbi:hypothetical protein A1O7_07350 [Cladophialophora yegresii CBS 114405]|uniref:Sugar phosphate transporter domain-containing protein n=1 Tax=Cladophialophora yegresii CBS 114405 TaxID=1182544 RepID=W9VXQ1_9EURO|nr:uncharacterized protein A1O7_07350 [Cladophialophora yegresii CBS 114405]EXJ57006.1 hypothetical protein A1O7_07350 [Cladophialophora yegresii CBS 114405]